ncbi:MAG: T9SS type A sorting domain-containing protein, partial [Bacteroidia bacterium]
LSSSISSTICHTDSIVVNGTTYNAANPSGTEVFSSLGSNSCDSTVTINLTVLPALSSSISSTICHADSIVVNGTTYNAANPSGTEVFSSIGSNSCDSTVTINLTVLPALSSSISSTICHADSIVVNGTTYNAANPSGTEVFRSIGSNSCDSTVTINLTVLPALSSSISSTICHADSIVVNGTTYNAANPSGTEVFSSIGSNSCDSTVTINLTVLPALSSSISSTICHDDSIVVNGTTYNAFNPSGTEVFSSIGSNSCDSTVTINLTVINAIDTSINISGLAITANQLGASYQWLDCSNGNVAITGATNASYTATENGNYAVEIKVGPCTDTSACVNITTVGIIKNTLKDKFVVYPNPTKGLVMIDFESNQENISVRVFSIFGQLIETKQMTNTHQFELEIKGVPGIYLLEISDSEKQKAVLKIIKE